ncbi:dihydrolipoamide acetyltransferase family protein [Nocardia sp. NPDC059177]|uniref:dihydrolipoamide acetyltransferase family protein n=1 Tax=Nocardia sp. NPDC059177 TaxID=3346759 RepID=UPI00369FF5D4
MDTVEFRLPDVGEGTIEAEVVGWLVAVGDTVEVNQSLVEVETVKARVELPSPAAGMVTEILAEPGHTVPVGTAILRLATQGVPSAPAEAGVVAGANVGAGASSRSTTEISSPVYTLGNGSTLRASRRSAARSGTAESGGGERSGIQASPPVRRLAKELGVNLADVPAAGQRVAECDVLRHGSRAAPSSTPDVTRVPVRGVRRATAQAVVASAFSAPHVTVFLTVDVTRTMRFVDKLKADRRFENGKITPLLVVARALVIAAQEFPEINASWAESGDEILIKREVNLGIAAATPRGLIVPNIKSAQRISMSELAAELTRLTSAARAGLTTPAALTGGTITVTNVGVFGVDAATPILNTGESAILCFGAVREIPWNHKGRLALRKTTQLSLSFDHRLIDGELGSRVLTRIGEILERPQWELALG